MRRLLQAGVATIAVIAAVFLACAAVPAHAEVSVNVNIGPPPVVIHEPPELIVVPRTMVYFVPAYSGDLFFYRGRWWTRHDGRWFRSNSYNGPWAHVGHRHVPGEVVRLRGDYRTVYAHEHRVPHGQLKKHWERRDHDRRNKRGEWKHWKEEKRERKAERKEEKEDRKGHGRGRRD
jgi:hypothetical protein